MSKLGLHLDYILCSFVHFQFIPKMHFQWDRKCYRKMITGYKWDWACVCRERKKKRWENKEKKKWEKKRFRMRVVYVYICQFCLRCWSRSPNLPKCLCEFVRSVFFFLHSLSLSLSVLFLLSLYRNRITFLSCYVLLLIGFYVKHLLLAFLFCRFRYWTKPGWHKPKNVYVYKSTSQNHHHHFRSSCFRNFLLSAFVIDDVFGFFFHIHLSNEEWGIRWNRYIHMKTNGAQWEREKKKRYASSLRRHKILVWHAIISSV